MKYDFKHPKIGPNGITFPEKERIDGFTLTEDLIKECIRMRLQFNRIRMIISDKDGEKLAQLRNLGNRLEFTDFVNNRKGYLNKPADVRIFVMELL